MPEKPKVSPAQRRDWLGRFDSGESQEQIAKTDEFTRRTVHDGIERARLELDFEAAQREQLREALREHQRDLLGQVDRIQQAAHTPALDFQVSWGRDFGLEDLKGSEEDVSDLAVPLAYPVRRGSTGSGFPSTFDSAPYPGETDALVVATRDERGPREIVLTDEGSPLWAALKQHVGSKDSLWRAVSDWRQSLLKELRARASLNSAIRRLAEEKFKLPVAIGEQDEPRVTPSLVTLVRRSVTCSALGQPDPGLTRDVEWQGRLLMQTRFNFSLMVCPDPGDRILDTFNAVVTSASLLGEAKTAAGTYQALEGVTRRVHDRCRGYTLLHHIPGRCRLCKKLGGQ